ncbi:MAG: helix-turn-helix transcriptional regulator [Flavobacteriaceae bacterium]|nr:MAG: helix-turn-helix transcriptional regulator [Flavobacteriaceae bacterium]
MNRLENISDGNSRGNFILSNIKQLERKAYSASPSVKMVLSGNENYKVNGRHYTLDLKRFLIVDNNNKVEINIDADRDVKGVCIFPNKDLLNEVAKTRISSNESLLDNPFENDEISLVHNQFRYNENRTGRFLKHYVPAIIHLKKQSEALDFDDFYAGLAECMIDDQLALQGKLKNILSVKKATKEELYRRVANAKDYMDDNYNQKISLDDLVQEAFLSKYHFSRSFKAMFHLSPYQYLLQLRLKHARNLLSLDYSYSEVSTLIGFSDGKNLRKAIQKMELK